MKKKIISDVILNMAATFIPMFVLQFVILPRVARDISAELYGQLLAAIAFVFLVSSTFGSALNNSKLIHFNKYIETDIDKDYNMMLSIFLPANIIIMIFGMNYYGNEFDLLTSLSLILSSIILLVNTYLSVEFRINLNFKNILISGVMLFIGYVIGYVLFTLTANWSLIYLIGFTTNLLYILSKTKVLKRKPKKTNMFKTTFYETSFLLGSGFLASLGTYIDKLIIFPLLGGAVVSVYYTSTILGKTIALAIGPITGVLLSYLAHMKVFNKTRFKTLLSISLFLGGLGYVIILLVSRPILTLVYPQYIEESMNYISVTTLSTILVVIATVINPVLLKFKAAKWQIIINIVYIILYIALGIILLGIYGLIGFCIGILVANIAKLIFMIIVYYYVREIPTIRKTSEVYQNE